MCVHNFDMIFLKAGMSIYVCVVSKLTIAGGKLKLHGRNFNCTFIYQFKSSAAKITLYAHFRLF